MKHVMGNSTRCSECYWYREKEVEDKGTHTGYCYHKFHKTHDCLGKKRSSPVERIKAHEHHGTDCRLWEDAEDRVTHFEVMCGKPEPSRTPIEQEHIKNLLRVAREEQRDLRAWYESRKGR